MTDYEFLLENLPKSAKTWLITGVAGFIGSNLLEKLLKLNQIVVGFDNFETGHLHNIDSVKLSVSPAQWANFKFNQSDIRDLNSCRQACKNIDYVLHQAALGSVPRSLDDPIKTNETNISGFLNMLVAARDANVKNFIYAASSSTYGDHPDFPKVEEKIGKPLSPYAVTKFVNEIYSDVFAKSYGFKSIGLRYFNVFGPRQDPHGSYAAVIPKWIGEMIVGNDIFINGDGETSRDFTFVENVVQANLLAATCNNLSQNHSEVFNVAVGEKTNLKNLYLLIKTNLELYQSSRIYSKVKFRQFRAGDVLHSQASIYKAKTMLGYVPTHNIDAGLRLTIPWYLSGYR